LRDDRERYRRFWDAFGVLMKEGIYLGDDEERRISDIALFDTSFVPADHAGGELPPPTTLSEYVARARPDQKAIYYLAGSDRKALDASPHLEAFKKRGLEVLFFTDPVDEWFLERFRMHEKLPLEAIDRGELDLSSEAEKEARETLDRSHRELLRSLEKLLEAEVKTARFSARLTESPAVLVSEKGAISPKMERILRAAHHDVTRERRILELNPDHPLIKRLTELHAKSPQGEEFRDFAELLFGQALLAEGSALPDASRFAKLIAKLMVASPA
jgi:molecular chaperone HtpG